MDATTNKNNNNDEEMERHGKRMYTISRAAPRKKNLLSVENREGEKERERQKEEYLIPKNTLRGADAADFVLFIYI